MELLLKRIHKTDKSTIGELSINGKFECYILEDVERAEKVHGKTAIPKGRYRVIVDMSNRFKRLLPLLVNVPNYAGVRIHPGNKAEDSEGCLLPGLTRSKDFVGNSRKAFDPLFKKIQSALKTEKVYITIE